jgi:arylsulfatase A-like enzyme
MAALPFVKLAIPPLTTGLSAAAQSAAPGAAGNSPNILIVVFDAFSARNMSLFGYQRDTTPNLNRLAERATVYHNHLAGGNYTTPGTSSLLTGTYPWTHRAAQHFGHVLDHVAGNNVFKLLPSEYYKVAYTHNPLALAILSQFANTIDNLPPRDALTLSDALWGDNVFPGDYPVAVHAERVLDADNRPSSSPFFRAIQVMRIRAAARANERRYGELFPRGLPNATFDAEFLLEDAIDWVAQLATGTDNPYFAYVHLFPPHAPYNTRRDFVDVFNDGWNPPDKEVHDFFTKDNSPERMRRQRQLYDEFIAYVDYEFDRLFSQLERSGALENTYLILTSDHGEMFERGFTGHGGLPLYDPVIHIPLMIWKPGQTRRVDVFERTSAVDVLPTLLHLTGQSIPDVCEGAVLPTFNGTTPRPPSHPIYSVESMLNNAFSPLTTSTLAYYQGRYKLIQYSGYEELPNNAPFFELFDMENDPEERENLYGTQKALGEELSVQLAQKVAEVNQPFQRS